MKSRMLKFIKEEDDRNNLTTTMYYKVAKSVSELFNDGGFIFETEPGIITVSAEPGNHNGYLHDEFLSVGLDILDFYGKQ